jgi:hypothetical protein
MHEIRTQHTLRIDKERIRAIIKRDARRWWLRSAFFIALFLFSVTLLPFWIGRFYRGKQLPFWLEIMITCSGLIICIGLIMPEANRQLPVYMLRRYLKTQRKILKKLAIHGTKEGHYKNN